MGQVTWAQRSTQEEEVVEPSELRQIRGERQELGSQTQLPLLQRVPEGQLALTQGSRLQTPLRQVVPVGQG